MSYDISLCDPVTHKPLKADSTHFIAGGMRAMGGTKELWLNVTYNYGHFYYRPEWLIIQNTLNEAHLSKESRKHIAMAAKTTMELDAVLAVLAMPLKLWKMPQQP